MKQSQVSLSETYRYTTERDTATEEGNVRMNARFYAAVFEDEGRGISQGMQRMKL